MKTVNIVLYINPNNQRSKSKKVEGYKAVYIDV